MQVTHHTIQRLFKIRSELQEVYWNLSIQSFAKSMIGIFIPIYLYTLQFSIGEVFMYGIFYFASLGLSSPLAASIVSKVGYKHLLLYQIPINVIQYSMLVSLQFVHVPAATLMLIAVVGGISASMYWIPMNSEFAKNTRKMHGGVEVAAAVAARHAVSIAAPTLAAVILILAGFNPLFAAVIFLFLVSVIPLFATQDYRGKFRFSQDLRYFFKDKRLSAQMFLRGMLFMAEVFMWPFYIFLSLGSVLDVGVASSFTGIGIAIFSFVIGKASDLGRRRLIMRLGGLASGLLWLARLFASTPMEFFLLSFMGGMFFSMLEVTVFSRFCDVARGRKVLDWVVSREMWISLGRILIAFAVIATVSVGFWPVFVLAAIASILFLIF